MTHWGYHLILDVSKCCPKLIRNPAHISKFATTLVKKIDMVAYGKPQVVHFGEGNKAGYTIVQLIETSNIVAHFVEETNDMYLDVFSCKSFDREIAKDVVIHFFKPESIRERFIFRDANNLK